MSHHLCTTTSLMAKPESTAKVTKSHSRKHFEMEEILGLPFKNTGEPVETIASSAAQRLLSQRTRTVMPTASALLCPHIIEGVEKKIELRRQKELP